MIINNADVEKTKQEIKKSNPPIIVQAQDDKYNRKILEFGKFQTLLSPEKNAGKNKIRQIDSGLNHVLAKIATKNKVSIGIDLLEISKLPKKQKAERISKIIQNIKICKKAKTKIKVVNCQKKQAQSFLLSLGASTQQAKESITF